MEILLVVLVAFAVTGGIVSAFIAGRAKLSVAATVFCGVFVQALPFLVLGVVVSGLVAAFVTPDRLARWLPRRSGAAVLVAWVCQTGEVQAHCGTAAGTAVLRDWRCRTGAQPRYETHRT